MNTIFQRKDLVKTSSKPGKTRLANIFQVGTKYYLTDLPGYGFAKMGKQMKEDLDALISWYLEERREYIWAVVMLVDAKLGAQQSDIDMYKYILELELPVIIVLSKADKISKNELTKSVQKAEQTFFGQDILAVSSKTKQGIDHLKKILKVALR